MLKSPGQDTASRFRTPQVRVHEIVPSEMWSCRYGVINRFEEKLVASDTRIVKCFLHISREEQRRRLIARLDNPTKRWKYNPANVDERTYRDDYQQAYSDALKECNTEVAVVCRAGRPQVVSQLGDHKYSRRAAQGDGPHMANPCGLGPRGVTRAVGGGPVTCPTAVQD